MAFPTRIADLDMEIINDLPDADFISSCRGIDRYTRNLCNSNEMWRRRFAKWSHEGLLKLKPADIEIVDWYLFWRNYSDFNKQIALKLNLDADQEYIRVKTAEGEVLPGSEAFEQVHILLARAIRKQDRAMIDYMLEIAQNPYLLGDAIWAAIETDDIETLTKLAYTFKDTLDYDMINEIKAKSKAFNDQFKALLKPKLLKMYREPARTSSNLRNELDIFIDKIKYPEQAVQYYNQHRTIIKSLFNTNNNRLTLTSLELLPIFLELNADFIILPKQVMSIDDLEIIVNKLLERQDRESVYKELTKHFRRSTNLTYAAFEIAMKYFPDLFDVNEIFQRIDRVHFPYDLSTYFFLMVTPEQQREFAKQRLMGDQNILFFLSILNKYINNEPVDFYYDMLEGVHKPK